MTQYAGPLLFTARARLERDAAKIRAAEALRLGEEARQERLRRSARCVRNVLIAASVVAVAAAARWMGWLP